MKKDIRSYTYEELQEEMKAFGKRAFGQNRFMSGFMLSWRTAFRR